LGKVNKPELIGNPQNFRFSRGRIFLKVTTYFGLGSSFPARFQSLADFASDELNLIIQIPAPELGEAGHSTHPVKTRLVGWNKRFESGLRTFGIRI
jgi:hypothetical protein